MATRQVFYVYETDDYDDFKKMDGNRSVDKLRFEKVKKSIDENGLRKSIGIVTDGRVIVDGQARFDICKQENLPFLYAYVPGLTIDDCHVLNSTNTNWTIYDFIKSYADEGDKDYIWALSMIEKYEHRPEFPQNLITRAITTGGMTMKNVKSKTVRFKDHDYAEEILELYKKLSFVLNNIGGTKNHWIAGVENCMKLGLDEKRLVAQMTKFQADPTKVYPANDDTSATACLVSIYNVGLPKNKRIQMLV